MHDGELVRMANQISDFFRYQGDEDDAMKNIARHINHFWAPSMRTRLVGLLEGGGGDADAMVPMVRGAVERYRDELSSLRSKVPGEDKLEQPRGGGDAG